MLELVYHEFYTCQRSLKCREGLTLQKTQFSLTWYNFKGQLDMLTTYVLLATAASIVKSIIPRKTVSDSLEIIVSTIPTVKSTVLWSCYTLVIMSRDQLCTCYKLVIMYRYQLCTCYKLVIMYIYQLCACYKLVILQRSILYLL